MHRPPAVVALSCLVLVSCSFPWQAKEQPVEKSADTLKLEQDAAKGDMEAEYNLGIKYYNGEEEPQDPTIAIQWFQKAADQGYDNAEYTMGFMTEKGNGGLKKDEAKAIAWYAKAAQKGHEAAIYHLGLAYAKAVIPPDPVKAYAWLSLVSDGDTRAAAVLADVTTALTPQQKQDAEALLSKLKTTIEPINKEPPELSASSEESSLMPEKPVSSAASPR